MKKFYLTLVASCLGFAGFGQATPTCYPTSTSWEPSEESVDIDYGVDALTVIGYSGSTLTDAGLVSTPLVNTTTGYLNRVGTIAAVNFLQGGVYACSATWGTSASHDFLQMWIDFNDDGTFQASEEVTPVSGYPASQPTIYNITIPIGANPGTHVMRFRGIWEVNATDIGAAPAHVDPCLFDYGGVNPEYWSGDVVDYAANIVSLSPCSGTPTAGTATGPSGGACSATAFALGLTGSTGASGLTYQWQSSSSSTGPWTNITGATTIPYSTTESAATYYRCVVTCTSSGLSANSSPVYVNYIGACYCVPSFYYGTGYGYGCSDYMIVGDATYPFYISGAAGTTMADPTNCTTSGYIDETTTSYSVSFIPGGTYSTTLGANIYGYSMTAQMWIDFNSDGIFQTTESVGGGTWTGTRSNPTITIPTGVTPGSCRMRVITQYNCCTGTGYSAYPSQSPCPTSSGAGMIY